VTECGTVSPNEGLDLIVRCPHKREHPQPAVHDARGESLRVGFVWLSLSVYYWEILSRIVTVLGKGETTREPNEAFVVNLSNAQGATLFDGQGVGTITKGDFTR